MTKIYTAVILTLNFSVLIAQNKIIPRDSIPIGFSINVQTVDYANQVLRETDRAGIPQQWKFLAAKIKKAQTQIACTSYGDILLWVDTMFTNIKGIGYDFEHWPATPDSEKSNPVLFSKKMSDFAHSRKIDYTLAPDFRFANSDGPSMSEFADAFVIQAQKLQQNIKTFSDSIKILVGKIRNSNKAVKIWVQIGAQVKGQPRSVNEMLSAADTIRKYADGISVFYGTELDTLKKFISILRPEFFTGIPSLHSISQDFFLNQNYPNPFNPSTTISYQLSAFGHVTLKVYDVLGREVATLVNEEKSRGSYEVTFNVETRRGESLPSGVYFYRLQAGSYSETKKMILLK
ncbi:MAG: T9SS type A sorting domain-containing protein [Bacteroidota bacterium]